MNRPYGSMLQAPYDQLRDMPDVATIQRARTTGSLKTLLTPSVPQALQDQLMVQQADRLRAYTPLLCLVITANAIAMTIAVLGDLPWWQQFMPPALIIGTCIWVFVRTRGQTPIIDPRRAERRLGSATWVAGVLGFVAGLWAVNAFTETEQYYCMVAPVFIGIAALVSATCLHSAPKAALAGMTATVTPVIIKMLSFDNAGVRAMAVMMILVTAMQASVVIAKFRETVSILIVQHELSRLAETDALTGLDNRHAFMRTLRARMKAGARLTLILSDLDGFKNANDTHGHLAGDAILTEVAVRLRKIAPQAISIARLGGDEFAVLLEEHHESPSQDDLVAAMRAAISLPFGYTGQLIVIGASFGTATTVADGGEETALIHAADLRLYADKAARRAAPPAALARVGHASNAYLA